MLFPGWSVKMSFCPGVDLGTSEQANSRRFGTVFAEGNPAGAEANGGLGELGRIGKAVAQVDTSGRRKKRNS